MVLFNAEVEITTTHAARATRAGKSPRSEADCLASIQKRFLVSGVTFLKTLVSDYQILFTSAEFRMYSCPTVIKIQTDDIFRPFVMRFLPYSSLSTADVDF